MPQISPLSVMNNPTAKKALAAQTRVALAKAIKAEVDSEETELEKIEAALNATYAKFEASGAKPLEETKIRTAAIALKQVSAGLSARESKATKRLARAIYHDMKTDKIVAQVEAIASLKVKARMLFAQTVATIASSESDLETQLDDTLVPVDENGYVAEGTDPAVAPAVDPELDPAADPAFAADDEGLFNNDEDNALALALALNDENDPEGTFAAAASTTADLADYLDEGNMEDNRTPDSGTTPLPTTASIKRASAVPRTQVAARADEAEILLKQVILDAM